MQFQPISLPAVVVALDSVRPAQLADALHKVFAGTERYFQGEIAVLDFAAVTDWPASVDWAGITALMRRLGLQPVAVCHVPPFFETALMRHHLASLPGLPQSSSSAASAVPHAPVASSTAAEGDDAALTATTRIVTRPVRSGQQIRHLAGDVWLLDGINPGGEVIAGGNIVCWGYMSGRTIAGAQGDTDAHIVAQYFRPELVAIAGIYQTFEQGMPSELADANVHVHLVPHGEDWRLQFHRLGK